MITRFHIDNFKSLVDFDLPEPPLRLGNFVCLVGMNGSGKTTVLQAFDFVSQMMTGRMEEWLERRGWDSNSLTSSRFSEANLGGRMVYVKSRPRNVFNFELELTLPQSSPITWRGTYNRVLGHCTNEIVTVEGFDGRVLEHENGQLKIVSCKTGKTIREEATAELEFEGSILSRYNFKNTILADLKATLLSLKSLELLTPSSMRRRSRKGADIGYGGEELSAYIDGLPSVARDELNQALIGFYPHLKRFSVTTTRGGWKKLFVSEFYQGLIQTSATHMNDGLLRVIAILAQAHSKHPILLFDEIENGINPELVEKLVDFLVAMKKQVIVTTHSPMVLNYLADKVARESVFLLYRDESGATQATRFFDLPEPARKLEALGPGEVFVDTNLTRLTKRLAKKKAITKSSDA